MRARMSFGTPLAGSGNANSVENHDLRRVIQPRGALVSFAIRAGIHH